MITVEYDPIKGYTCPDGLVEKFITEELGKGTTEFTVSSNLMIQQFRLLKKCGVINEIQFRFKDRTILVDKNANLDSWPEGFCDYEDKILMLLIGW